MLFQGLKLFPFCLFSFQPPHPHYKAETRCMRADLKAAGHMQPVDLCERCCARQSRFVI